MRYFFLLLLLFFLCTSARAQNITITASIGLAEDQCDPVINDPNTDCINVPLGNDMLTYLPGQDGQIIVTYRLTNNSAGTITQASVTDAERGVVVPVTMVNIPPGMTVVANRVYPAETIPGTTVAVVTANIEGAGGASLTVDTEYTLEVVAPSASLGAELYLAEELCTDPSDLVTCGLGAGGTTTIELPPGDMVYLEMPLTNTGLSILTNHSFSISEGLGEVVTTGFSLNAGASITTRYLLDPPDLPGTYNYTITYQGEDLAGNTVIRTEGITVVIAAPMAATSMELYVARDICDDEDNLISCAIGSGGTNALTIPAGRYVYLELNVENTGVDSLTNHGGSIPGLGDFGGTSFRLRPGSSITMRNVLQAPLTPGTYDYTVTYTSTDLAGTPLEIDMPITLTVPELSAATSVELYVARDVCDDEDNLISCGVESGGGTTLTIPAGRYVYMELNVDNTHIDTLINHGGDVPGLGVFGGTSFRLRPGGAITMRNVFQAPLTPGVYNYTVTYSGEDQFGNPVENDMPITLTVPDLIAATSVELYVARDVCDDEDNLISCGVESGGGTTLTIPAGRYVYMELNVDNTHIDTLINHGGDVPGLGVFGGTSFRLRPGGAITMRNVFQAPLTPGVYNYTVTYSGEDQFGNPVENDMPITLTIPAPAASAAVELYRASEVCTDPSNLQSCGVSSGGGNQISVGVGEWLYLQFPVQNIGVDTLTNHDVTVPGLGDVGGTSFRLRPDGALTFRGVLQAPNQEGTFDYTGEYTATDQFGNGVLVQLPMTIKTICAEGDFGPPVALCRNRTVTLTEGETQTISAGQINNGSFDACGGLAGGSIDVGTFSCDDEGMNTVTLTVEDLSGNTASCTSTVTVIVEDLIAEGQSNNCVSETHAVVGGQTWNDLTINGQLVAQVIIGANSIDEVRVDVYKNSATVESIGSTKYLSKRIALTMLKSGQEVQPNTDPVYVRLYYTAEEIAALQNSTPGSSDATFTIIKTSDDDCGAGYSGMNNSGMNTTLEGAGCSGNDRYFEFFTGTFSTFYLFSSDAVLPVEMSSFTASILSKERVQLSWMTVTESGNSHFEVERSLDGRNFTYLGAVAGVGESAEEQWYDFVDEAAVPGRNYYRLRQVDFDGTATHSDVRLVTITEERQLSVYPNPATDEIRIAGFAGGPVRMLDGQGKLVLEQYLGEAERLSVVHLSPGFYLLQTPAGTLRWVKQ